GRCGKAGECENKRCGTDHDGRPWQQRGDASVVARCLAIRCPPSPHRVPEVTSCRRHVEPTQRSRNYAFATQTRLRPSRLAACRAWSAAAINTSGEYAASGSSALTPTLTVTCAATGDAGCVIVRDSTAQRRRSPTCAAA